MHLDVRAYANALQQVHPEDPVGFLTFHHFVIGSFSRTWPENAVPMRPSSLAPFPAVLADQTVGQQFVSALSAPGWDFETYPQRVGES